MFMLALAGLAYTMYRLDIPAKAAEHAELLWQVWQESPAWAERANLKLYWMLGMVWQGLKDKRFKIVREKAQTLLQERSEKIPDDGAHGKCFLKTCQHIG